MNSPPQTPPNQGTQSRIPPPVIREGVRARNVLQPQGDTLPRILFGEPRTPEGMNGNRQINHGVDDVVRNLFG